MITHLESDILECEVKWALGSITTNKSSGGDGVPVELFQILKDDMPAQYASKFGRLRSGHRTGKGLFSFQSQTKVMPKNVQTTTQLHSSHTLASNAQNSPSQASTVREPWTSRCSNWIYKRQRTRDQIANIHWIIKKESSRKTSTSLNWLCQSHWLCGSQETVENSSRWEYQTTWPASWETYRQVRKQQLELDMEQQTGSKWKRSTSSLYIVTLLI